MVSKSGAIEVDAINHDKRVPLICGTYAPLRLIDRQGQRPLDQCGFSCLYCGASDLRMVCRRDGDDDTGNQITSHDLAPVATTEQDAPARAALSGF